MNFYIIITSRVKESDVFRFLSAIKTIAETANKTTIIIVIMTGFINIFLLFMNLILPKELNPIMLNAQISFSKSHIPH